MGGSACLHCEDNLGRGQDTFLKLLCFCLWTCTLQEPQNTQWDCELSFSDVEKGILPFSESLAVALSLYCVFTGTRSGPVHERGLYVREQDPGYTWSESWL